MIEIAAEFRLVLSEMSVYLLFGFLVAGLLSVFVKSSFIEKHLGGGGMLPPLKAALFGVPLPLCSCSVIPVSMSLFRHGASRGAVVAFLLSAPQTGIDSILVTLSLLGPVFAVFRPVAALVTGLVGGGVVDIFDKARCRAQSAVRSCSDQCCSEGVSGGRLGRALRYGFLTLPRDIGPALLVGIIAAAVISVVIPKGFLAEKLGTGIFAMLVMMAMGIPVYVCATASVPVAAALMIKGLTPGAAVVFLMTGPATNAASFVTIWKTLGARTAVIYILAVGACALGAGLILDTFIFSGGFESVPGAHRMLPQVVKDVAAVVLMAVLVTALITRRGQTEERETK